VRNLPENNLGVQERWGEHKQTRTVLVMETEGEDMRVPCNFLLLCA
jgi:hypothetical protein